MKSTEKSKKRSESNYFEKLGWNTTDFDELNRRRLRGKTEDLLVQQLNPEFGCFDDFWIYSKQRDPKYLVEIRSLVDLINSCSCLDYLGNGLGTCKHIEHVLFKFRSKQGTTFNQEALKGSSRIEIYVDRKVNNVIKILWPKDFEQNPTHQNLFKCFDEYNNLIIELLTFYEQLPLIINDYIDKVRISRHINDIINKRQAELKKEEFKQQILNNTKEDLNILKLPLYPYQQEGILHLALTERALLADDMGLGKTAQAIGACELLYRFNKIKKVLIITTASLKSEWVEQIDKFTTRGCIVIQGGRGSRLKQYQTKAVFYLVNYEQIIIDGPWMQHLLDPDIIILDEAQRIKNWQTKTAHAIKKLKSHYAFVLTGTPLENRIDDLYSIVQFLDPNIFGPLFRFNRDYYQFDQFGKAIGYKNLDQLNSRLKPIMLRRLKKDIETELPKRTIKNYIVKMDKEQQIMYEHYAFLVKILLSKIKNRNLRKEEYKELQRYLACMRMVCDTPYILNPSCKISPKLQELATIIEDLLLEADCKIIIFSEWSRMLELVRELAIVKKINFAWHTGSVSTTKRREEINKFKTMPNCRLFLSTDAGSIGLNLQSANVVINLDLPWNPAKLEQRIARAWRKNQTKMVRVINFVCKDSIEERILGLLSQKQDLASSALDGGLFKDMAMPSSKKSLVDKIEELISKPVKEETNYSKRSISPLEVIDDVTFKLLKHLEQKGILTINQDLKLLSDPLGS